jgi:ABC-type polysaccharide/polyol phosphate export permease
MTKQFLKEIIDFFYQLFINRQLILTLTMRDFEKAYIKNFFGFVWAILDPLAFVVILYIVFGTRYGDADYNAVPFAVYLITGHIAFELFSSTLTKVTKSIAEHSYLLKKVNFRVAILPLVTILSNLMVHAIVLVIAILIVVFNHFLPTWYWLQLLYYIFALSVFLVSAGWLTSSIYLFFPDISNIVGIITRALFFLTPIFWNIEGLPESFQNLLKLNPLYYIVAGYRDSLINQVGVWHHPLLTVYYWTVCLVVMVAGVLVFKKLRPHFADVVAG